MAIRPTRASKRKVTGGRVTPKASGPAKVGATPGSLSSKARTPVRRTAPMPSPADRKREADRAAPSGDEGAGGEGDAASGEGAGASSGRLRSKRVPAAAAPTGSKRVTERPSSRYTAPLPPMEKVSPWWVPALMFTLLGLGMLVIFLNYLGVFSGGDTPSNVPLVIGLGMILAGIVTATQYH